MLKSDPTPAHLAQTRLECTDLLTGIATQSVDGLGFKDECRTVFEMYSAFLRVEHVDCGVVTDRTPLHERLTVTNPDYPLDLDPAHVAILTQTDREVMLVCDSHTVPCETCRGLLEPTVTFSGQLLSETTTNCTYAAATEVDMMLVVGNSLVVGAAPFIMQVGLIYDAPLVIINHGRAQYNHMAGLRTEGGANECLTRLAGLLGT